MAKGLDEDTETGLIDGEVERPPLEAEIRFYERHLPEWKAEEGRFVLIYGDQLYGFHATRDDAMHEGYRRFGYVSYLVKRVLLDEKPRQMRNGIY